tara:strand:+ start:4048 stop:5001 length:954 start_codon:yes stop_codon:yes gene_type:complete
MQKKLSVLFSFKNEAKNLPYLIPRVVQVVDQCIAADLISNYELIFIDDCSNDSSLAILKKHKELNSNIKVHSTTRPFGNQECLRYAINQSMGDYICYLDADLQDPPEIIFDILSKACMNQLDVVYTQRISRAGESRIKLLITWFGYRFLSTISSYPLLKDSGDFTLISRRVADQFLVAKESLPYIRGFVQYLGYPSTIHRYHRSPRHDGQAKTKFPIFQPNVWYGYVDRALLSTTDLPLKILFPVSFILLILGILLLLHVIFQLMQGIAPPGWSSIMVLIIFSSSFNFLALAFVSLYVNNIYLNSRARPDIVIREIL